MSESAGWGRGRLDGHWRLAAWSTAGGVLLLPLLAMQVTDEVDWDLADFLFAAALVVAVGLTYEIAARMTRNRAYRAGVGVALAAAFMLVWVNAAVGIIGSEENPANLMYGGVLAVGIVGAIMARFQAEQMVPALVATALAQALVALIALVGGLGSTGPNLGLTGFFAALWLLAAWLFRRAARQEILRERNAPD